MHKKHNITAIVLTFNEEKNITSCLESIKWADEIIILDSYSWDNTLDISKKYTKNIYFRKFDKDYSKQRNFAISKASNDWILFLDSDESIPLRAELVIRNLIKNEEYLGFWFRRRQYINKSTYLQYGHFYPDWQLRLLRNNKNLKYKGTVHELPTIPFKKTYKTEKIEIYHNYTHTKYDSFRSFFRFIPYIKAEGLTIDASSSSTTEIAFRGITTFAKEFWSSVFREKGYKDKWPGIRAAFNYSLYKYMCYKYAMYLRLKKVL